ncbi:YbhB/YbcL family Raf kinase inhibitor-like protein [Lentzea sp. NPDC051213]|uniref:YbhB/YbcL family Raf kinase inhibitor-like protein n=1 Tax=Lentzea sp. NPDC051213 TaxID=3364126 RepID=UPI0037A211E3
MNKFAVAAFSLVAGIALATPAVAAPAPLALTSTAYQNNGNIPDKYSCAGDHGAGNDISPPLAWTGGDAPAQSYALVFIDTSNGGKHWAAWDIPATAKGLPEGLKKGYDVVEPELKGAHQRAMGNASVNEQFFGPCPRSKHKYEFTLYAVKVKNLPGITKKSKVADVEAAAKKAAAGQAKLAGFSTAKP